MIELFNTLFVNPIINILVVLYHLLQFLHVPFALGFAIILLTVLIRLVLYPLTHSQLRTSRKMQNLSPHLSKLKDKHKDDKMKLQQETMRLYKEHGINPASGCLLTIVQLPVIYALYGVLQKVVQHDAGKVLKEINAVVYSDALKLHQPWDAHFFGIALGQSPAHLMQAFGPIVLLVPVITGATQLIQSKMMFSKSKEVLLAKKKEIVKKKEDDFATAFQTQALYIFPAMIGFFSFQLPMGLSLYWNTYTIFGILQQYHISGLDGISEWIAKIPGLKKKHG